MYNSLNICIYAYNGSDKIFVLKNITINICDLLCFLRISLLFGSNRNG